MSIILVREKRLGVFRYPLKALWSKITEAVGDADADLEFWGGVIKAWLGCGWNPQNVAGMLDYHHRRELPKTGRGRRAGYREGRWTEKELNEAKVQSTATCPLETQYGCTSPSEFFDLSDDEKERRELDVPRRVAEWARDQAGEIAEAIRVAGGVYYGAGDNQLLPIAEFGED